MSTTTDHNSVYEQVIAIAERVKQIDSRIFCYADGAAIKGSFRGKDSFLYNVSSRSFSYNKAGGNVSIPFSQAVKEILG